MPSTLSPQPSAKTKPVVLPPNDALKETLRRRNIGRPCPHCHMPLTMGKYVTGDRRMEYPQFAYYQCKGYTDPVDKQRYSGCGGSHKLRVMTEAEQLALLQAGRIAELEDYLRAIDRTAAHKKIGQLAAEHLTRLTAGKDGATLSGATGGDVAAEPSADPQYVLDDETKPPKRKK